MLKDIEYLSLFYIGPNLNALTFFICIYSFFPSYARSISELLFLLIISKPGFFKFPPYKITASNMLWAGQLHNCKMAEVARWNEESYNYKVHHLCEKQVIGVAE